MKRFRFSLRALMITILVIAVFCAVPGFWYHRNYPYGASHRCIKALAMALQQYAEANSGFFPAGGATPEGSLSRLQGFFGMDAEMLGGMTIEPTVAQKAFDANGCLGPQSCGWHYVEGLTLKDDYRIAILWCKESLGHNGQRTDGGREVVFVNGMTEWVSGADWTGFLADQEKLLAARPADSADGTPTLIATIRFSDGTEVDEFDGTWSLQEQFVGPNRKGGGLKRGPTLDKSILRWFKMLPQHEGGVVFVLSLPGKKLKSKPVEVQVTRGVASPRRIVFEMEPDELD